MAKLWEKGFETDPLVMRFTVGDDYITDMQLVPADVFGSIAHARTLFKCDILTLDELHGVEDALKQLLLDYEDGKFEILAEHEDVHTAVENYLVEKLGDLGKKIHIGRSRND
jgi:argininosuccinate lyase